MSERCAKTIYTGTWSRPFPCSRKAVKDGWCKQHHPDAQRERDRKSEEKYRQRLEASPWTQLERSLKRTAELESLVKQLEQSLDAEIKKVDLLEAVAKAVLRTHIDHSTHPADVRVGKALRAAGYLGGGE